MYLPTGPHLYLSCFTEFQASSEWNLATRINWARDFRNLVRTEESSKGPDSTSGLWRHPRRWADSFMRQGEGNRTLLSWAPLPSDSISQAHLHFRSLTAVKSWLFHSPSDLCRIYSCCDLSRAFQFCEFFLSFSKVTRKSCCKIL